MAMSTLDPSSAGGAGVRWPRANTPTMRASDTLAPVCTENTGAPPEANAAEAMPRDTNNSKIR